MPPPSIDNKYRLAILSPSFYLRAELDPTDMWQAECPPRVLN
jgi:hypothetical protein